MAPKKVKERFEKMEWSRQLGNLASTLGRVSTRAIASENDELTKSLLHEAILFIEWSAPHVPETYHLELAIMQRELLAWKRAWPLDPARPILALEARNRSDRLLQMAGLVG
ncbi:MAG TPA: hypothetical protein VI451_01200 [Anaerolineales bacterium]|jgi:hypothetical protein|nr:hypothetical protein [Anaerolineales bacterium]